MKQWTHTYGGCGHSITLPMYSGSALMLPPSRCLRCHPPVKVAVMLPVTEEQIRASEMLP